MAEYFYSNPSHTHVHAKGLGQGFYRTAAPQLPLRLCEAYEQAHREAVCPCFSAPVLARRVPEQNMGEFVGESGALHRPCHPTPEPDPLPIGHAERRNWFMGIAPDSEPRELVQRDSVSVIEIWCECLDKRQADLSRRDSYWIGNALKRLGWEAGSNSVPTGPYGRQREFVR